MSKVIMNQVLEFIRQDGPLDAPICFLTIEDGGDLSENEFDDYINGNDHWLPGNEDRPLTYKNTGLPGEFISKIMCGIFDDFKNWSDYRAKKLYSKNEINIKFYPIGRKNTSIWESWLEKKLNVTNTEYIIQCLAERHKIIYEKLNGVFNKNRIFIILGARDEWSYFLKKYVFNESSITKEIDSDYGYEFFYDNKKKLLFSYYPMFKRGARSSIAIKKFCSELKNKLPPDLTHNISI